MTANIKTTIGGLVALVAVGLLALHQINTQDAVLILGVAGGWIGIASADANSHK